MSRPISIAAREQKWIRDGRGEGHGQDYKPWLTVRDLPSKGRSHRIYGAKTKRTHHLLSDLELATFLILDWHHSTLDIREQFPLRIEDTLSIAKEAGIKHPRFGSTFLTMTTDFLVNTTSKSDQKFAIQVKYSKSLDDPRTIEKLEIERRYWEQKEIKWQIITEKDFPKSAFENIDWLYSSQSDEQTDAKLKEDFDFYCDQLKSTSHKKLSQFTNNLDQSFNQEAGKALSDLKRLLADRYFLFDLTINFRNLMTSDLKINLNYGAR